MVVISHTSKAVEDRVESEVRDLLSEFRRFGDRPNCPLDGGNRPIKSLSDIERSVNYLCDRINAIPLQSGRYGDLFEECLDTWLLLRGQEQASAAQIMSDLVVELHNQISDLRDERKKINQFPRTPGMSEIRDILNRLTVGERVSDDRVKLEDFNIAGDRLCTLVSTENINLQALGELRDELFNLMVQFRIENKNEAAGGISDVIAETHRLMREARDLSKSEMPRLRSTG